MTRGRKRVLVELREELRAFAITLTQRPDQAEDLVQEAIARALSAPKLPRERRALRAWTLKTIRNLHIDPARKRSVRREYEGDVARFLQNSTTPEISPIDRMVIRQALDRLGDDHREILCMVDILGMRYAEVAKVLDIPEGTVMSRVSRARAGLLEEMESAKVVRLPKTAKAKRE